MKTLRGILFGIIIAGVCLTSLILFLEKPKPPLTGSFAPLFQELGKPLKTADRVVSRLLPVNEIDERMLGEEIKLRLSETLDTPAEAKTVEYLNSLVTSLSSESKKSFKYRIFLVEGSPNAFAMPGGAICVTKELMNLLENEAELVAILGHEIGHVEMGHLFDATRGEMLRNKIVEATLISYASDAINTILNISFSKEQEDEADEYGFRLLLQKGYDPIAFSTVFEKLKLSVGSETSHYPDILEDFFATHPNVEFRIEKFRSLANVWKEKHPNENRDLGIENFRDRITIFEKNPQNITKSPY